MVNYLDILFTNKKKCIIVEFTISCRKGIKTNSENSKSKSSAQIPAGEPG